MVWGESKWTQIGFNVSFFSVIVEVGRKVDDLVWVSFGLKILRYFKRGFEKHV